MKKSRLLLAGSGLSLALFVAMPSFAQDAPAPEAEESTDKSAAD
jgi:hypothetical protein